MARIHRLRTGLDSGNVLCQGTTLVVPLDEVEKAHPDVLELFFQVFDKGRMEDGEDREIDFRADDGTKGGAM